MLSITPCRRTISDRFPVASFVVHVPPQRVFEIACATDTALFRGDRSSQRTAENFFSSRGEGLLRAPAGQATYLLPSDQLRRFAGQRRLYYAVASYADPRGSVPEFTVAPNEIERAPFVALSPDFTGRSLDRSRLRRPGNVDARYGASAGSLAWGGDGFMVADQQQPRQQSAPVTYDDGYPGDLWTKGDAGDPADPRDPADPPDPDSFVAAGEPDGYEDAPALRDHRDAEAYGRRSYGGQASRAKKAAPRAVPKAQPPRPMPARVAAEPAGFEDAVALRAAGAPARPVYGRPGSPSVIAEPPGAADPDELRRPSPGHGAAGEPAGAEHPADLRVARRYGDGSGGALSPEDALSRSSVPPVPFSPPGVADEYDDSPDPEGQLPPCALESSLTVADKFRLLRPIARFESGPDGYRAINADGEFSDPTHAAYQRKHYGLHWGLVQLNQRSGALGRALVAADRRQPAKFSETFGAARDQLLQVTTAPSEDSRVQPVASALLWQEPWVTRFRAAGEVPEFQAAQNQEAIEGYCDPNLAFAEALGLDSDRALALVFDRCIDMGNAGGRRFIVDAVSPLTDDAAVASALRAAGHDSPQAFQRSLGLAESTSLGPKAHAALLGQLRSKPAPGMEVPSHAQMVDALVAASRGRRFEQRVKELRSSTELSDSRRQVN